VDTGNEYLDKATVADMTLLQISEGPKEFETFSNNALGKPYQATLLPEAPKP